MTTTHRDKIIYRAKPHWMHLTDPPLLAAVALFCAANTMLLHTADLLPALLPLPLSALSSLGSCAVCLSVLIIFGAIFTVLSYINVEYIITSERLIVERGIFNRRSEIFRQQINGIDIKTPRLGKFLGYGTIVVHAKGNTPHALAKVTNPQEFRQRILGRTSRVSSN